MRKYTGMDKDYIAPTNKLWHHIDRLAEIKAGGHPAPVNVEIDVSNRCQMGCSFCHFAHVHSKGQHADKRTHDTGDLMGPELAFSILDQLAEAGIRSVTWSGGGEPTLNKHLPEIVEHAYELGLDQGIYTNGLKLETDYVLRRTLKRRMKWIYLSHGPHGLEALLPLEGDATIGVGMMVESSNIYAIYANASKASNADYFHIRPVVGCHFRESELEIIDLFVKAIEAQGINIVYDPNRFKMLASWQGHGYKTCYWTQVQAVITPDGRVWACCNRRGFDDSLLGDLNDEKWMDVWNKSHAWTVNGDCRTMCRGHIPNMTLTHVIQPENEHQNFI